MSLLDNVIQKPNPQSAGSIADRAVKKSIAQLKILKDGYEHAFYELWGRPGKERSKEDVQAIIDVWGTKAVILFSASYETGVYLLKLDPDYALPSKLYDVQINEDGTVTVL